MGKILNNIYALMALPFSITYLLCILLLFLLGFTFGLSSKPSKLNETYHKSFNVDFYTKAKTKLFIETDNNLKLFQNRNFGYSFLYPESMNIQCKSWDTYYARGAIK